MRHADLSEDGWSFLCVEADEDDDDEEDEDDDDAGAMLTSILAAAAVELRLPAKNLGGGGVASSPYEGVRVCRFGVPANISPLLDGGLNFMGVSCLCNCRCAPHVLVAVSLRRFGVDGATMDKFASSAN